jgi:hypothetical protein
MLFELFAFGTFWFYLLMLVAVTLLYWSMDQESGFGATLTLLGTAVVLWLFGNVNLFSMMFHNPLTAAALLAGYFAAGMGWGIVKWKLYNKDRRERLDEFTAAWKRRNPEPTDTLASIALAEYETRGCTPEEIEAKKKVSLGQAYEKYNKSYLDACCYEKDLVEKDADGDRTTKPYVRNHKGLIMTWMSYWPLSASWAVLDDFVHKAFKIAYRKIAGHLQTISDNTFRGAEGPLVRPPTE